MERTHDGLAEAIIASLDDTYTLVDPDYRDQFTDKQTALIVRGDYESLWETTEEWESDRRHESVVAIIGDAATAITREWAAADPDDEATIEELRESFEHSDGWDRVREVIWDRDVSDWAGKLANATPQVLLRIPIDVLDEDHAFNNEPVSAVQVLTRVGLPVDDDHNLKQVAYALDNASPEYSILMGYWIVGADVAELYAMAGVDDDTLVEIHDPHLYIGNPFAGSGFITDAALHGMVTVRRGDLRTDADAFGYAVNDVYGGLTPSTFSAKIQVAASNPAEVKA